MDKTTAFEILGFILAFLGLGIGYLAVYMGVRHERQKRELEHRERMTALEMGQTLPRDLPWLSPVRVGFLIALLVPTVAFLCAWLGTRAAGYHEEIWKAAALVGVSAVGCGSLLGGIGLAQGQRKLQPAHTPLNGKLQVEDDAYDVVSARG
jgi:hypothetical protein